MPRPHRRHSTAFTRQLVAEYHAGATLHGLSKQHGVCRNLIRVWVDKVDAGLLDEETQAADLLQDYEARIAALELLVGRQALEIEFLKGAARSASSGEATLYPPSSARRQPNA
jgi:transposase-like protein